MAEKSLHVQRIASENFKSISPAMRGLTVVTTLFIAILVFLFVFIVGKLRVLVLPIMPRVPW